MINIYQKVENELKEVDNIEKNCWINAINPTYSEVSSVSKKLGVPEEFLTDPLDIDERARIETEDEYLLIIIRVPVYNKEHPDIPYYTVPLGIIFSEDSIISVSSMETGILSTFLDRRIKNFSLQNKERFILLMFLRTAILYLKYLRQIQNMSNNLENELHKSMKNQELIRLLDLEKSLVYFTTALKANEIMIGRLYNTRNFILNDDDKDLLDDVIIEFRQAIEMANIYSNILSGMMDAFASVISNNVNVVMKFLTSISIILMFPTLVASIYGMNIDLPLQGYPHAFAIVMAISFGLSLMGFLIFAYRKWL